MIQQHGIESHKYLIGIGVLVEGYAWGRSLEYKTGFRKGYPVGGQDPYKAISKAR